MMTQIIKEMLNSDIELVGELENNASEQYGLAKLAGRYVIICNDVDSNWTLDATQFTKMVSGKTFRSCTHCLLTAVISSMSTLLLSEPIIIQWRTLHDNVLAKLRDSRPLQVHIYGLPCKHWQGQPQTRLHRSDAHEARLC